MFDEVRLIDVEKLMRKFIEGDGDDEFTEGYNAAINDIKKYIDNMPTVEAAPDKGWISVEEYYSIPCSKQKELTEDENRQVCEYIKNLMKDVPITVSTENTEIKWMSDKGWISVKDRLPEPETWVMVYIEYPSPVFEVERGIQKMSNIKKMFYDGKSFYCDFGAITHWQPLPEPPKGEYRIE